MYNTFFEIYIIYTLTDDIYVYIYVLSAIDYPEVSMVACPPVQCLS